MRSKQKLSLLKAAMSMFNFEAVRDYMVEVRWRWATGESRHTDSRIMIRSVVPTLDHIRRSARQRCLNALTGGTNFSSSGGITAKVEFDTVRGTWTLTLSMQKKNKRRDGDVTRTVVCLPTPWDPGVDSSPVCQ